MENSLKKNLFMINDKIQFALELKGDGGGVAPNQWSRPLLRGKYVTENKFLNLVWKRHKPNLKITGNSFKMDVKMTGVGL